MLQITDLCGLAADNSTSTLQTAFFYDSLSPVPAMTNVSRAGYTVVTKIPASSIMVPIGRQIRLTLSGVTSGAAINAVYIGNPATSGNAYDFNGSQVQVTFSALSGFTIASQQTGIRWYQSSDVIDFSPTSNVLLVAYNIGSGTGTAVAQYTLSGATTYYKSAVQAAATSAKATGYTAAANVVNLLHKIETA